MSEDRGPVAPGWYPVTGTAHSVPHVGYWDGAAWTGVQRPAGIGGGRPRDEVGTLALVLLVLGFFGTIAAPFAFAAISLPNGVLQFVMLVILALTPIALVTSILGLVRGFQQKFKTPTSLAVLIVSALGTIFLVLPIGLFVTGVWVLPHL